MFCREYESLIAKAIMEGQEKDPDLALHLKVCPDCRAMEKKLEADLSGLGRLAARMTPSLSKRISLPAASDSTTKGSIFKPVWGFAATAALLLAFILFGGPMLTNFGHNSDAGSQQIAENSVFNEFDCIYAKNNLPEVYMDIIGEQEADDFEDKDSFDMDFLDFVAPLNQESPLTIISFSQARQMA